MNPPSDAPTEELSSRLRKGELFSPKCPSRAVLRNVTSRWGTLVLVALLDGTHRFGELRKKVGGVSEKMLAQTLHALEDDGFVNRTEFQVVPPHVEYDLTPIGREVALRVKDLFDWIESNLPRIMTQRRNGRRSSS